MGLHLPRIHLRRFAVVIASALACLFMTRESLAIEVSGGITTIYQSVDDARVRDEATGSTDLFLSGATDSGEWLVYLEGNSSLTNHGVATQFAEVNADAGSALDPDRSGRIQASEIHYTFKFETGSRLVGGLIDPSNYLDRSRITNDENLHFLGASFVNNPSIEFPDYALGAAYIIPRKDNAPEMNFVISSSNGIADNPNHSYAQLGQVNQDGKGVFLGAGFGWPSERVTYRVGSWVQTHDHPRGDGAGKEPNYGVYGVAGWRLGRHALNTRLGFANANVSAFENFAAIAYEYKPAFGLLGIALAHIGISDKFATAGADDTLHAELFYRIPLKENGLHLTVSAQYIENPGFDSSNSIRPVTATVLGLRLYAAFD